MLLNLETEAHLFSLQSETSCHTFLFFKNCSTCEIVGQVKRCLSFYYDRDNLEGPFLVLTIYCTIVSLQNNARWKDTAWKKGDPSFQFPTGKRRERELRLWRASLP